jgi:hypothetical protein
LAASLQMLDQTALNMAFDLAVSAHMAPDGKVVRPASQLPIQLSNQDRNRLETSAQGKIGRGTWETRQGGGRTNSIAMTWTPGPESERTLNGDRPPASDVPGPSVFTAIQEQLGLRLVAGKGPVQAIVIDSVEKASGN